MDNYAICRKCGNSIPIDSRFCNHCGCPIDNNTAFDTSNCYCNEHNTRGYYDDKQQNIITNTGQEKTSSTNVKVIVAAIFLIIVAAIIVMVSYSRDTESDNKELDKKVVSDKEKSEKSSNDSNDKTKKATSTPKPTSKPTSGSPDNKYIKALKEYTNPEYDGYTFSELVEFVFTDISYEYVEEDGMNVVVLDGIYDNHNYRIHFKIDGKQSIEPISIEENGETYTDLELLDDIKELFYLKNTAIADSLPTNTPSPTPVNDPIVADRTSFKDMGLNDICKKENIYIGLQYVKTMDYLPTALGGEEKVPSDKEVILGIFEYYNGSDSIETVSPENIKCYVDGTQVSDVETYIKVYVDGVRQHYYADLAGGCQMLDVRDFEVPKGWKEIKFYYGSDCIWNISSEDTSKEPYVKKTLFDINGEREDTKVDDILYSGRYEVQYKGTTLHTYNNAVWGEKYYAVFKFRITNNSDDSLDTGLMGYEMSAYQNNYLLSDASYTLSDKVDGYINIFDIDDIAPQMAADIYVAFEIEKIPSKMYLIYDDGYITNNNLGYISATLN